MKKIAVVLSGCGFQDGAEITEAVSTLIALSELGVEYRVFAPDLQAAAVNHLTGETGDKRGVMQESARISRGQVENLSHLRPQEFDGVAFPGGFGAALHLCDWAEKGSQCSVHAEAQRVIEGFYNAGKPIAALCIAPALVAKVLGGQGGVSLTIGNDSTTAEEIAKTGAQHVECAVDDFVSDRENKIITTPAYMYDNAKPYEVFTGVRKAIKELVEMA